MEEGESRGVQEGLAVVEVTVHGGGVGQDFRGQIRFQSAEVDFPFLGECLSELPGQVGSAVPSQEENAAGRSFLGLQDLGHCRLPAIPVLGPSQAEERAHAAFPQPVEGILVFRVPLWGLSGEIEDHVLGVLGAGGPGNDLGFRGVPGLVQEFFLGEPAPFLEKFLAGGESLSLGETFLLPGGLPQEILHEGEEFFAGGVPLLEFHGLGRAVQIFPGSSPSLANAWYSWMAATPAKSPQTEVARTGGSSRERGRRAPEPHQAAARISWG